MYFNELQLKITAPVFPLLANFRHRLLICLRGTPFDTAQPRMRKLNRQWTATPYGEISSEPREKS